MRADRYALKNGGNTRAIAHVVEKPEGQAEYPRQSAAQDLGPFQLLPDRGKEAVGASHVDRIRDAAIERQLRCQLNLTRRGERTLLWYSG